ncbi:MAG TPA: dihydroorotate dehydrogenase electron transfer subunit [Clostridia bacterium]|nr:dihydroorotate dehydrogenase electron transfer subunit [Clostridia bacterium]
MQEQILKVISNVRLNESTYKLELFGDDLKMSSGQFVEVKLDNFYLRRPFSVAKCEQHSLTLLYKVVGFGTKEMTEIKPSDTLSVLTYLGVGFDVERAKKPLLIGGGIGSAPLYQLALEFNALGIKPTIILGFRNKAEIFYYEEFKKLGDVIIATDDGSFGEKANAVSVLKSSKLDFDFYYACGPMVMLKALAEFSTLGQLSLEARMACGFGACMGCTILTTKGAKRVCKEGPVFNAKEVVF